MSNQLERESNNENNFTEDWNSLTDKIQSFNDIALRKFFSK